MAIESTASMRTVLTALGPAASRFGVGPIPAPGSNPNGGVMLGGAAAWIMKDRPAAEQQGAWEFLKYATQPSVQAQWSADTGYFPVRVSAWNMEPAKSVHEQFPQFTVAHDQVVQSPQNDATAGAVLGPFTQVRDAVTNAIEEVLVGGKTPEQATEGGGGHREPRDHALQQERAVIGGPA